MLDPNSIPCISPVSPPYLPCISLQELVLDPNSIQRIELAGVLMDLAAPLGKAQALELVFPTIAQVRLEA